MKYPLTKVINDEQDRRVLQASKIAKPTRPSRVTLNDSSKVDKFQYTVQT
jgi:hypothetical protein